MAAKKKSTGTAGPAVSSSLSKTNARARRRSLRLHGTIARDLGVLIVSGRYKPGDLLNGEIAASDRLHVSRGAYREAVRILAAKGLVESRPKVGTRISQPEGGFVLWIQLPPDRDGDDVHREAAALGINILPGSVFSPSRQYRDCIRISCGHPFDAIRPAIRRLAALVSR